MYYAYLKTAKRYKHEKWKFFAGLIVQIISSGSETVLNDYTNILNDNAINRVITNCDNQTTC
jgi:hypothetical protein